MSHGGGGGANEIKAEPNLTPLLDLVLQLVMFFLLVANFSVVQANKDIDLPKAQSARPVVKEVDVRSEAVEVHDPPPRAGGRPISEATSGPRRVLNARDKTKRKA